MDRPVRALLSSSDDGPGGSVTRNADPFEELRTNDVLAETVRRNANAIVGRCPFLSEAPEPEAM